MTLSLRALFGFALIGLVVSFLVLRGMWLEAWPWALAIVVASILLSLLGEAVMKKVEMGKT